MTRYLVSPDVLVSHLEGEAVLLHMGTKQYYQLNRTGAHIWKAIEGGADSDAIAPSIVEAFEVSLPEAQDAVQVLLSDLMESTLITASDAGSAT